MKILNTFLLVFFNVCLLLSGCKSIETSIIEPVKVHKSIVEQNGSNITIIKESIIHDVYFEEQNPIELKEEINSNSRLESIPSINNSDEIQADSIMKSYNSTKELEINNDDSNKIGIVTVNNTKLSEDNPIITIDAVKNKSIENPEIIKLESVDTHYSEENKPVEKNKEVLKVSETILAPKSNPKIISEAKIIKNKKDIIKIIEIKKDIYIDEKANEIVDNLIESDRENDSKSENINILLDAIISSEKNVSEKSVNINNTVIEKNVPANPDQIMEHLIKTETTRENASKIIEVLISSDIIDKKN